MTELTQHQVERRFQTAAANPIPVTIPALPGLFFRPLTLGERGQSSRAYSRALMGYMAEGLPSEHLLQQNLRKAVEASGLSVAVLKRKGALYAKQMSALTEDLIGPYDQLTPAEVAELPLEVQAERMAAIEARGKRVIELLYAALTDEEREELNQIHQIEQLEQHLRQQTAEFAARRDQQVAEILMGAIGEDGKSYLATIEELSVVEPLVDLLTAWYQFREGQVSDFFSRS
jgi:hypothetical protein